MGRQLAEWCRFNDAEPPYRMHSYLFNEVLKPDSFALLYPFFTYCTWLYWSHAAFIKSALMHLREHFRPLG